MSADDYDNMLAAPRLTPEEVDKLVQRLYYRQLELTAQREKERQATLERTRAQLSRHVSKEEEEHLVNRIYDQQLQRFANAKEERDKKVEAEAHRNDKKVSQSEIDHHVYRMYDEERAKSRTRRAELSTRYMPTAEPKKIGKADLQACVERLSHVDWEKRDEELFKKYVYPYDPKTTKISPGDEQAMADRLSTTKGASA
ncbi:hypothetical protein ABB37_04681 [Leptomonas pyrrhocoris]|uniref:Uncharacterized protein n=1 Tax=Leptomonas pyrrhocoris TaxID=157538 RepID=A0A0M9G1I7_LEPPY|nr:hypothetical protein ABB37_04681 [Leptomonas pyrrhocoris]KPA80455.1 hypothetical protein ABB37_04681 [Leptomonas pyrrhocoris]|eukprot:XP_015658894.1 hypothetical protein ABB37_04681 [Leptomonas pyrrhocoris]